jgi:hypothetical protein
LVALEDPFQKTRQRKPQAWLRGEAERVPAAVWAEGGRWPYRRAEDVIAMPGLKSHRGAMQRPVEMVKLRKGAMAFGRGQTRGRWIEFRAGLQSYIDASCMSIGQAYDECHGHIT